MTFTTEQAKAEPLVSDELIEKRVSALIGKANVRQWWTLLVDDDDVQIPVLMPMDGLPFLPPDGAGDVLAHDLSLVMNEYEATQAIFVWERPWGDEVTPPDREWARALAESCAAIGVRVRAQLICHRDGVRWFAPDDYLSA